MPRWNSTKKICGPPIACSSACPAASSGIEIARRLGLPARVVDRARASLSPEAREARDLIAYLHRSRDEMEQIKRQPREELRELEAERRSLQTEWVERQRKRIAELEKQFRRHTEEARKRSGAPDRRYQGSQIARASRETIRRGAWRKSRADARGEADAAVVETLAARRPTSAP